VLLRIVAIVAKQNVIGNTTVFVAKCHWHLQIISASVLLFLVAIDNFAAFGAFCSLRRYLSFFVLEFLHKPKSNVSDMLTFASPGEHS